MHEETGIRSAAETKGPAVSKPPGLFTLPSYPCHSFPVGRGLSGTLGTASLAGLDALCCLAFPFTGLPRGRSVRIDPLLTRIPSRRGHSLTERDSAAVFCAIEVSHLTCPGKCIIRRDRGGQRAGKQNQAQKMCNFHGILLFRKTRAIGVATGHLRSDSVHLGTVQCLPSYTPYYLQNLYQLRGINTVFSITCPRGYPPGTFR